MPSAAVGPQVLAISLLYWTVAAAVATAATHDHERSSCGERVHALEAQLERERQLVADLRQQLAQLQDATLGPPPAQCTFPAPSSSAAAAAAAGGSRPQLRMNTTCSTASLSSAPLEVEARAPRGTLYADTRTTMFDMAPESSFAQAASVKVATVGCGSREWQPTQNASRAKLQSQLQMARADGAEVALMFEYSLGAPTPMTLSGPEIGAVRALAREIGIVVICPLNLTLSDGTSRNAAVVILSNGTLLKAAYTGGTHAEKNYPGYGWRPGMANYGIDGGGESAAGRACPCRAPAAQSGDCVGPCVQGGEENVIPSQVGVEVFDLPGIARVAILMCFDVNFPEVWCVNASF